jgi:glutamate dehydrogenase/leucine dehydrogenase
MARNTKEGRVGAVRDRIQVKNPVTGRWVKIDTRTGKIVEHKKTAGPYKGIRQR